MTVPLWTWRQNRVVREELWKVLSVYGLDEQLIQGVKSLYCESKACVRVGEELTDWFDISMGVRQGCVMSPSLFNLYIDSCINKLAEDECGTRIGSTQVSCLMYADDAVLLAPDDINLQSIVTRMSEVLLCQESTGKRSIIRKMLVIHPNLFYHLQSMLLQKLYTYANE